ncbi:MAG: NUDIX domain-containing protein [Gammaproteobacteria bacterium]|nr:MAG: NUDIX domain-containing protein [Gammaproteobacteria bacterium]
MAVFKPTFTAADSQCLADDTVYDGFFRIRRVTVQHALFAGGSSPVFTRELFERGQAVGVLPYDPVLDQVVLIEQFRVGAMDDAHSPWLLELVAGMIETGENAIAVARRETEEESGLSVQSLWPIGCYYSSPGGSSEQLRLFCGQVDASAAGGVHGLVDEHEDIRVHVFGVSDVPALLAEGSIRNVHTAVALQWLLLHADRVREAWQR